MQTFELKRVLLWIESSRAYGRGCLMGVAAYCATHSRWRTYHVEHTLEADLPDFFGSMKFDGVIARAENDKVAEALQNLGVPVVDLRGSYHPRNGRMIDTDPAACAELAFEHFWARGMTTMAFCGYNNVDYSDRRRDAFLEYAHQRGVKPHVYESASPPRQPGGAASTLLSEARGEIESEELLAWLRSLPKPVAVFASNDIRGRQVLSACTAAGIAVPEQVAVLGVDNDEVICELAYPPLTSIEPDTRAIGYAGAASLDRLLTDPGITPSSTVRLIQPTSVVTRQSTDITAIEDLEIAQAVNIIRKQAGAIRSVGDLATAVGISRATLERRFRTALGRSPRQEIDRVRLNHARTLVRGTTYPLHQIAELVGYSNPSRLLDAYKRRFGVTPGVDRTQSDDPFRDLTA